MYEREYMKKYLIAILIMFLSVNSAFSMEQIIEANQIQTRIDDIGMNILNNNKIPKRVVFVYDKRAKKKALATDKTLTKRQVIIYDDLYQSIQTDDELAGVLSREIATAIKTYDGKNGSITTIQIMLGAKKFETYADQRAVDYIVKAGYNPLALIIHINKVYPQKKFDKFSRHNLTSRRLARIYEYITYKYPKYLKDNEFVNDKYYQNFLLTSLKNRKMLNDKIIEKSNKELKYE